MQKRFSLFLFVAVNLVLFSTSRVNGEEPVVMAHYMPWFVVDHGSEKTVYGWHWTMNKVDPNVKIDGIRNIASHFRPLVEPYDSADTKIIEYHLLTMKLAGIDGVIVDWYGRRNLYDYEMIHHRTTEVLKMCERLKMKFAICYEDKTVVEFEKANQLHEDNRVKHCADEIQWLGKYWFKSASYLRYQDKPVLLSFGHEGLRDKEWGETLSSLDSSVAYFTEHDKQSAAIGAYDWPEPSLGLEMQNRFAKSASDWPVAIPVIFPRFVDYYQEAGVLKGHLDISDNDGATLKDTIARAKKMDSPIIQIATWNDWGEGTQIEPSHTHGYRDLEILQQAFRPELNAENLRLPKLLLEQRHQADADHAQLDQIANLINDGELSQAKTLLDK
jgi:hypothetical protein